MAPKATPSASAGAFPTGIAVSPDGKSVYVVNNATNGPGGVSQYDVGAGGELTPKATATVAAGKNPVAIAVSPDGRNVYVTNSNATGAGGVSQYDVGAGGELTPKSTATVAAGTNPAAIAVSPDGKSAYVTNSGSTGTDGISQYDIGTDGALTPKGTATVAAGTNPAGIAVSPDGKSAYVANASTNGQGGISQYDVGAAGALTSKANPTVAGGNGPFGIAGLPDPGPVAAFSATTVPAGSATAFDGSASTDPLATVVQYAWSFGDGATNTTTSAHVTHVYDRAGTYTATLTVTDDIGCSTAFVFTGQTAYCGGGSKAITTRQLSIRPPRPTITKAQISEKRQRAKFSFEASGTSGFQCALVKLAKHRKKHHKQPAPHFKACRSPKVYKHLKAGRYEFFVRALATTGPGDSASRSVTIR